MIYCQVDLTKEWKYGEAHLTQVGNGHVLAMRLSARNTVYAVLPRWIKPIEKNEWLMRLWCRTVLVGEWLNEFLHRCYFCHCDYS